MTIAVDFPCPICGSNDHRLLYPDTLKNDFPRFGYEFSAGHTRTYRIVMCENCGHAYCSPRPLDIWKHYHDVEDKAYLGCQPQRISTARKVLKKMLQFKKSGRLLDIGCATGDFLSVARDFYEVEGLELSRWTSRIALGRGLIVHSCTLDALKPAKPYDVMTLWGVIEHFEDPAREIQKMARLLNQGGYVCLWTGDIKSIPSKVLGKKWWYVQGQHIQYFSQRSLRKIFSQNGFEHVWSGLYPYVMTMDSISGSLNRYPLIGKLSKYVLKQPFLSSRMLTLALPGEMFAIFRKL